MLMCTRGTGIYIIVAYVSKLAGNNFLHSNRMISWAPIPFLVSYIRAVRFGKRYADKAYVFLETIYASIPIVNRALTPKQIIACHIGRSRDEMF